MVTKHEQLECLAKPVQSARPAQPAQYNSWHERGELPPVGCECNYVTGISCVQVKIQGVGHVDGYPVAFFVMKDSWCTATAEFFRPIRTEREKAIEEMAAILVGCEKYAITQNLATAASELLYDAGCRMVKP